MVDIGTVRLVANLVEKDFRRVQPGVQAIVEVDAFPGEQFTGKVSRVAPVFDPATRTATMEIEVPNPGFRLKPGMYARVRLTAEPPERADRAARRGRRCRRQQGRLPARRRHGAVPRDQRGHQDADRVEVLEGLDEGTPVVTRGRPLSGTATGSRWPRRPAAAAAPCGRPGGNPVGALAPRPVP